MTDIAERLRGRIAELESELAECCEREANNANKFVGMLEERDTIRAENEALRERVTEAENRQGLAEIEVEQLGQDCLVLRYDNVTLRAENTELFITVGKLREALRAIDEAIEDGNDIAVRLIARAALQDGPGSATYNQRWKSKP
jgi:chromosome segregation ATPase